MIARVLQTALEKQIPRAILLRFGMTTLFSVRFTTTKTGTTEAVPWLNPC